MLVFNSVRDGRFLRVSLSFVQKNGIMRNLLLMLSVGALLTLVSCNRDNPKPLDLPGQPFEASLTEVRSSKTFHWQVLQDDGGHWVTDNGEESIRTLYVTAYNSPVVLETTAEVNIESSDAKVIAVVRKEEGNNRIFHLVYKGEGQTTIRLWNGTGAGEVSKSFDICGREYVALEGILFTYGGEPLPIKHYTTSRPPLLCKFPEDDVNEDKPRPGTTDFSLIPYAKPMKWDVETWTTIVDPDQGTLLTFEGLIPENTSFRTVESFESEWECIPNRLKNMIHYGVVKEGEYEGKWPNVQDSPRDVSEYIGAKMWIACCNGRFYMASLKFSAPAAKYFYLYHAMEDYEE